MSSLPSCAISVAVCLSISLPWLSNSVLRIPALSIGSRVPFIVRVSDMPLSALVTLVLSQAIKAAGEQCQSGWCHVTKMRTFPHSTRSTQPDKAGL